MTRTSPARRSAVNPPPRLFAVGGAHIDRRGRMTAPFVPGASIPGTMTEETGGGTFNAIRAAVQRGVHATLMSVRGADSAGEMVAQAITEFGIADMSAVFLDRATPSYTALVDRDGEVLAGLADMALYEVAFPKQLRRSKVREAVAEADAIFCDANLPRAALETLTALGAGKPIYAIAISPAKATRLAGLLDRLACLYMNMREASALAALGAESGAEALARELQKRGLKAGVITAGAGPITGFDRHGIFALTPPKPRRVADATGAGDALAGATTAAMMRGQPLRAALREGMAAAMLTIESPAAVARIPEVLLAEALVLIAEPEPA
ncbi:MAG TPA: carbohydrate kinase family protein [Rhizobiaceae bacterium]|nr:carbohydrate kinase family protein [Rhizobiaceae bacterium]